MIEAFMYGALGFFVAGLISAALVPSVWRRAVRLTRQAIEATSPLSSNDVQAKLSSLRAEHAISYCRLERRYSSLREELSENRVERDQANAYATSMKQERDANARMLAEATSRNEELHLKITSLESDLAHARSRIRDLEREVARRERLASVQQDGAPAGESETGALDKALREVAEPAASAGYQAAEATFALEQKVANLEAENASLREDLARARESARQAERLVALGDKDALDKAARDKQKALENKIFDMETRYIAAQAEITRLNLQLERLEDNASGTVYGQDDGDLKTRLAALEAENSSLRAVLSDASAPSGLREVLKDIAARITAQIADEADLLPISGEKQPSTDDDGPASLVDRIRAACETLSDRGNDLPGPSRGVAARR